MMCKTDQSVGENQEIPQQNLSSLKTMDQGQTQPVEIYYQSNVPTQTVPQMTVVDVSRNPNCVNSNIGGVGYERLEDKTNQQFDARITSMTTTQYDNVVCDERKLNGSVSSGLNVVNNKTGEVTPKANCDTTVINLDDVEYKSCDVTLSGVQPETRQISQCLPVRQNDTTQVQQRSILPKETVPLPSNQRKKVTDSQQKKCSTAKKFTCDYFGCGFTTGKSKDYVRHYRIHTGETPYRCHLCHKEFNRSDKLKMHLRTHTGQKPHRCDQCDYASVDSSSLKKHMRIHTGERPYKCQICSYASRNSSQLVVHLRIHTGDSPFHCDVCPAQFKIKSDLTRHSRIHSGDKPFACDKCEYCCTTRGNLKTHQRLNHSTENAVTCPKCNFVTSSVKRYREHIKSHDEARMVKCSVCSYTCNNSTALRNHMVIHNSLRPYRCSLCPYATKQRGNLTKHVNNVHHEKSRLSSSIRPADKQKKGSNSSKRDTSNAIKKHKPHLGKKRTKIPDKNASNEKCVGPNSSRKQIHACHICNSGFVRHDSLKCHLKQHHDKHQDDTEQELNPDSQTIPMKENTSIPKPPPPSSSSAATQVAVPPPIPQPPPPLYPKSRNQGLEQIIAAASQLYREQCMKGEVDEDFSKLLDDEYTLGMDLNPLPNKDNKVSTSVTEINTPSDKNKDVSQNSQPTEKTNLVPQKQRSDNPTVIIPKRKCQKRSDKCILPPRSKPKAKQQKQIKVDEFEKNKISVKGLNTDPIVPNKGRRIYSNGVYYTVTPQHLQGGRSCAPSSSASVSTKFVVSSSTSMDGSSQFISGSSENQSNVHIPSSNPVPSQPVMYNQPPVQIILPVGSQILNQISQPTQILNQISQPTQILNQISQPTQILNQISQPTQIILQVQDPVSVKQGDRLVSPLTGGQIPSMTGGSAQLIMKQPQPFQRGHAENQIISAPADSTSGLYPISEQSGVEKGTGTNR